MIFLPFVHFFAFISCIFLAAYVFYKDSGSLLNRLCAILMICYALWNFGDIILHNPDKSISESTVVIMQNIASVGWIGFASVLIGFSLVFSKNTKLLKKKWFLTLLISLPLLLLYQQFTNRLTINPTRQIFGWSVEWANTLWTYLFYVYYLIFTLLSIAAFYVYGKKTKIYNEKKQAKIIVNTFSVGIIAGTLFDVVFQELGFHAFPPITNLLVCVFASGVLYAIFKYRFLTITPTIAAENIISAMDEFLILLDLEGRILTVNAATIACLHFKQNELQGQPIAKLFDDEIFKQKLLTQIKNEEIISNRDAKLLTKNKNTVPIIFSSTPVKDHTGMVIGTVFIARDITLHKQIENELIKSKEKAEESDRLKTAFLANMSHEIRTPMNGILGFASLLKQPELAGEKQQEYIQIIEKSGVRMLNIINDIIDISKIEAGMIDVELKDSNINEQIEYIYTFFKPEIDAKGMQLLYKNDLPSKSAHILTDREKVFAILTNLIKNAIKYSKTGTIEFGYKITQKDTTPTVQFYVKDTGIGIPADRLDAIFERFVQADIIDKMARQGAGLGLSITKAYVEKLGGKIWVESQVGSGSTFYFTLPYITQIKQTTDTFDGITADKDNLKFRKLKVLIADDDEISEKLITISIKKFCKEIVKAGSGIETVEICRQNNDFHLILMDIQMPDMNGYEATRQIRRFNKDIIIIAQTAFAQNGDKEKAIEAGCNDYISKPINPNLLQTIIQKHYNTALKSSTLD